MIQTFWQRARRVGQAIQEIGQKSIREIANAAGMSKSAAQRHLQAREERNKYPESYLWESMAGQIWLVRLVIAVIYFFGIKRAVGSETISEFFHAIRINTHLASSPGAIRTIRKKIEELIIAYGDEHQKEGFKKSGILYVIGGVDETFFRELMVLVLLDLPTGYVLMEEISDNRTYTTWSEKISAVLSNLNVEIRYLVSDRAPALIKLATDYFECSSIADIFHALHKIAQTFSPKGTRSAVFGFA